MFSKEADVADFEKNTPVKQAFTLKYIYRPDNVGFMRPKLYHFTQKYQIFYLSPTKVLLH